MKRLTDNEIIKALQCCSIKRGGCKECPLWHRDGSCTTDLAGQAFNLASRQQAEIDQLKKVSTEADNFARAICNERTLKGKSVADFEDLQEYIEKQKSEAIKEFAERLKELKKNSTMDRRIYTAEMIENLVKEMVGEIK